MKVSKSYSESFHQIFYVCCQYLLVLHILTFESFESHRRACTLQQPVGIGLNTWTNKYMCELIGEFSSKNYYFVDTN